ncbi:hypothetical protein [Pseudorhodoplanes sp.]|uniref:hypothetical protein n=1 Tax=Pseudorhodoplanes sp. TaxID=1934341 RepID=UPI002C1F551F|nr:hypothetical protein [Pseudorhodoplanes sp.]HWV44085.1 hypothetical protein [Pseudorhodoplanes sp.]
MAIAALVVPAGASWRISEAKDRMTGKNESWAALAAKNPDQGMTADLELSCAAGGRLFTVKLSAPLTRGKISARLRADDGPVQNLAGLRVYSDPHRIPIVTAPRLDLAGRKRFRVELFPTGSPPLFYDFDLTGIDRAMAAVRCR